MFMGLLNSIVFLSTFSLLFSHAYAYAYGDLPHHSANISTLWTNSDSDLESRALTNNSYMRYVLFSGSNSSLDNPGIGFGFFRKSPRKHYYLIIFFNNIRKQPDGEEHKYPQVLWTANTDKHVGENATLELTASGDLILKDAGGYHVWSTNTSRNSVAGITLTETGNLLLHTARNKIIWQSFDHPTETWILGQKLTAGQRLTTSVSDANHSFHAKIRSDGRIYAYINSNPAQLYTTVLLNKDYFTTVEFYITQEEGKQMFVFNSTDTNTKFHFIWLQNDGHLRVEKFMSGINVMEEDVFTQTTGACVYPTVCGNYGICSNGNCSCPIQRDENNASYFRAINATDPSLGCAPTTMLTCANLQAHSLVELADVDYFSFIEVYINTGLDSCKQACLNNCSCKAVIFRYSDNPLTGNCSLPSEIFSIMHGTGIVEFRGYHSTILVKVEASFPVGSSKLSNRGRNNHARKRILLAFFSVVSILVAIAYGIILFRLRTRKSVANRLCENDSLDQLNGSPRRFCFKELQSATGNFKDRLGGGGFGSVFGGKLADKTKVAVKRLDQQGQGRREFLAEVNTIGSIHHVNLVRLIGFCAEKSHKLLVYEHMRNGSLDEWIFDKSENRDLDWQTRRNIIHDIAKGLSYLHEECHKTIVHLDIKPQNILLDDKFKAKVSDFGLARFIDRDQSKVLTALRGTRGYLAPEWFLNRSISEKVDVYSFGVVVLEIVCGRKNLDNLQPEENECLLHLVRNKAEEGQLFDMVDKQIRETEQYREEVVKMLRMSIWCLLGDSSKRPSMSMVVKALEGGIDVKTISDFSFLTLIPMQLPQDVKTYASDPPVASVLSGPR